MNRGALLTVLGVCAMAGTSQAGIINVDFGDSVTGEAAEAGPLASGVVGISTWNLITGNVTDSALLDDVGMPTGATITVAGVTGKGSDGAMNDGAIKNDMTFDYVKNDDTGDPGAGDIVVTVKGLAAGDYTVYGVGGFAYALVGADTWNCMLDAGTNGSVSGSAVSCHDYSGSNVDPVDNWSTDTANDLENYNTKDVTLADGDELTVVFSQDVSGYKVNVAGMQITPEPATMALLGLGGLGVLARRRRR